MNANEMIKTALSALVVAFRVQSKDVVIHSIQDFAGEKSESHISYVTGVGSALLTYKITIELVDEVKPGGK